MMRLRSTEAKTPEVTIMPPCQQIGRPVIKAFNNIYARHLLERGNPAGVPGRIALAVAGDDDAAKTVVLKLVEELGFDGVDAGGLDESWRQQPGTPVYTKDFDADGVRRGLYEASKDRAIEWRGTPNNPGTLTPPPFMRGGAPCGAPIG